uniref:Uncharacterized protein n=1 Tax=Leersia perrieri TaxID=77586 RepID=A0A0D9X5Z8_9ORYZ
MEQQKKKSKHRQPSHAVIAIRHDGASLHGNVGLRAPRRNALTSIMPREVTLSLGESTRFDLKSSKMENPPGCNWASPLHADAYY